MGTRNGNIDVDVFENMESSDTPNSLACSEVTHSSLSKTAPSTQEMTQRPPRWVTSSSGSTSTSLLARDQQRARVRSQYKPDRVSCINYGEMELSTQWTGCMMQDSGDWILMLLDKQEIKLGKVEFINVNTSYHDIWFNNPSRTTKDGTSIPLEWPSQHKSHRNARFPWQIWKNQNLTEVIMLEGIHF